MRRTLMMVLAAGALQSAGAQSRAVVVTGASSGIGLKITEKLAAAGYTVYAGVLSLSDPGPLRTMKNVQVLKMDVTSASDIAAAAAAVQSGGHPLAAVVNNAGVLVVSPLAEMDESQFNLIMGVNLYGPVRVTKAFVPQLIASKGRVVSISSLNGIVAQPIIGAYSITKHGVEAFGDALAGELEPLGVRVSLIEPGNYGTNIGKSAAARTDTSGFATSRFGAQMRRLLNSLQAFDKNPPPDDVANAVLHAIESPSPKRRYLVVPAQGQADIVLRKLMSEVAELNADHPYSRDRDALVKMLDEELAKVKARP